MLSSSADTHLMLWLALHLVHPHEPQSKVKRVPTSSDSKRVLVLSRQTNHSIANFLGDFSARLMEKPVFDNTGDSVFLPNLKNGNETHAVSEKTKISAEQASLNTIILH